MQKFRFMTYTVQEYGLSTKKTIIEISTFQYSHHVIFIEPLDKQHYLNEMEKCRLLACYRYRNSQ